MRRILAVFAVIGVALASVTVAFAHAEPATIKPGDGAIVNQVPAQIDIETTEDMARQAGANDIVVVDASGKQVTTVAATIDNADRKHMTVPLPSTLAVGTYTVRWTTLSADDGDAASGQTSFTYDPSKTPVPGTEILQQPVLSNSQGAATPSSGGSGGGNTSWIVIASAAIGVVIVGGGAAFLFAKSRR